MQLQDITAYAAVAGVIIASVSAFAATRSATNTAKALADGVDRAREQSRPIVVAELRKHQDENGKPVHGCQDLVIKNYGSTPARTLGIMFDPPIPDPTPADEPAGSLTSSLVRRLGAHIPTLSPGTELVNVYVVGDSVGGVGSKAEPLPGQISVALNYTDMAGHPYRDVFALDVNDIALSTHSRPVKALGRTG